MNRELHIARSFKIDFKKLDKSEKLETREVVLKLQKDEPLEERFKDHSLHGNYEGFRECHIRPDLLLVYKKTDNFQDRIYILALARIDSHTNIFDIKKKPKIESEDIMAYESYTTFAQKVKSEIQKLDYEEQLGILTIVVEAMNKKK